MLLLKFVFRIYLAYYKNKLGAVVKVCIKDLSGLL
jgi:hypothetical protein